MSEPVRAFGAWVRDHIAEFDAARQRFDQRDNKGERGTEGRPSLFMDPPL
jgi:hypothetical protein